MSITNPPLDAFGHQGPRTIADKIILRGDRILIKADPPPKKTSGGILLPGTIEESLGDFRSGTVVAVGPGRILSPSDRDREGREREPLESRVGMRIVYHKRMARDPIFFEGDDTDYLLLGDRDVVLQLGDTELVRKPVRVNDKRH